eukprot:1147406-Pelagomonas_calceolata.AAC.1
MEFSASRIVIIPPQALTTRGPAPPKWPMSSFLCCSQSRSLNCASIAALDPEAPIFAADPGGSHTPASSYCLLQASIAAPDPEAQTSAAGPGSNHTPASTHWDDLRGIWKQSSATLVACTWYAGFWAAPASWLAVAASPTDLTRECRSNSAATFVPAEKMPMLPSLAPQQRSNKRQQPWCLLFLYLRYPLPLCPSSTAAVVSRLDLLHAVYLGAIALHCLGACVCPTPKIPSPNAIKPRHRLIRTASGVIHSRAVPHPPVKTHPAHPVGAFAALHFGQYKHLLDRGPAQLLMSALAKLSML